MAAQTAILCAVYNEQYFLPLWYTYYAKHFGKEHLYIIDDGSTDGSTDFIPFNRIRLPRAPMDDISRVEMISQFQAGLLSRYDTVLYADCDEFIVPRPGKYTSLQDYITKNDNRSFFRCVGVDVMQQNNNLPALDLAHPVLPQRPYGYFSPYSSKPIGGRTLTKWQPGFHEAEHNIEPDRDLWLFHLKWADLAHTMERLAVTRTIEWSPRALAQRLGFSHRVPDSTMLTYIHKKQATLSEESLDNLDFSTLLSAHQDSDLQRIPTEFLAAL